MTIAEHGVEISGIPETVMADILGNGIICTYTVSTVLPAMTMHRRASTSNV